MWKRSILFCTTVDKSGLGRTPYGPDHGRWYPVNCQTWTSSDAKTPSCIEMDV